MRGLRAILCAVALTASLAPGVRADEYTKQTFLTFSGPVQLPGITLAAGTYQFKLADPESGRRALQVWDKDGTKLYATLLTIPDQRMKATDKPVVMFTERPSGEAQPIRAWFYPNETYGQEFVYPKEQAMKIARDTHSSVLAFNDDTKESEYKSAKISRMDENGNMSDADKDKDTQAASATTASSATTTADARSNTAPQSSTAQSDASLSRPAQSARAETTTAPAATSTTSEANRDNMPSNHAVGTSGSLNNASSANRTGQAASGANAAAPRANNANAQPAAPAPTGTSGSTRTLPRTAGSMTLVELLAGLSLAAAFALRVFRVRSAQIR